MRNVKFCTLKITATPWICVTLSNIVVLLFFRRCASAVQTMDQAVSVSFMCISKNAARLPGEYFWKVDRKIQWKGSWPRNQNTASCAWTSHHGTLMNALHESWLITAESASLVLFDFSGSQNGCAAIADLLRKKRFNIRTCTLRGRKPWNKCLFVWFGATDVALYMKRNADGVKRFRWRIDHSGLGTSNSWSYPQQPLT